MGHEIRQRRYEQNNREDKHEGSESHQHSFSRGRPLIKEEPELSAEHEQISRVLLGALRHLLGPVPQLLEAVVDVPYQLSARGELSLDVGREIFLQNKRRPFYTQRGRPGVEGGGVCEDFPPRAHGTNLRQGRDSVGHELVARFLVGVAQLGLDILCRGTPGE